MRKTSVGSRNNSLILFNISQIPPQYRQLGKYSRENGSNNPSTSQNHPISVSISPAVSNSVKNSDCMRDIRELIECDDFEDIATLKVYPKWFFCDFG